MQPRWTLTLALITGLLLAACAAPAPAEAPTAAAPVEEPAQAAAEAPTEAPSDSAAEAPAGTAAIFVIDPAQSEARFIIDEILRGQPTTVVGITSQVSGSVTADFADPSSASISPVVIQAADLTTDNSNRNRAINQFILRTGQFPEITFTPTSISGLPDSVAPGDSFEVQISGILSIVGIDQEISFSGTITASSATEISGSFATEVDRTLWGLEIPSVPSVAGVEEVLKVEFDFVALGG